jgi:plastocyanin
MRRRGKLAAATAAGVLLIAPAAIADEEIVGATPNRYTNPNVTIDQGEPLTFRNTDFAMHDVTSDAQGDVKGRLFASDTIGSGSTSFVEGSQYLTAGTYTFFCTIHPEQMKGTLTVTSAGTPKPRPGTGAPPPADTTGPALSLSPRGAKAKSLKKGRALTVDIGTDEPASLTLTVKLGSLRAARVKESFTSAGSRRLSVTLNKKARKKLRRGSRLTLTLDGTDSAGNPAGTSTTLKLR